MTKSEFHATAHRRLSRKAMFVSVCSLVCAGLAMALGVRDFWVSGLAFNLAAACYGLASYQERKAAVRELARERGELLRVLMGSPPS